MPSVHPQISNLPWWLRYRNAAFVALLAIVVMLPAVRHDFINWDDNRLVTGNEAIQSPAGIFTIWSSLELPSEYPNYPLTLTTYWLEHQLWGLHPAGYHIVNILLHAANALLVLVLLRRLGLNEMAALLAAILFAVHPMQVESVAWVSERKNTLFTMFSLLSVIAYVRYLDQNQRKFWTWAFVAFIAALLSKTAAVTVVGTLIATIWLKRDKLCLKNLLPLVPFMVCALLAGIATTGVEAGPREVMPLVERPLLAANTLGFYLTRLVFPVTVVPVHPKWQFTTTGVFLIAPLALLVVAAVLYRYRHRAPRIVWWGMVHFLASLLPFLGLIGFGYHETSYVADRFVYFACIGLFAPMAVGLVHLLSKLDHKVALGTCSVYVGLLAGVTMMYVGVWRDSFTLWTYTLQHNPDCARAHNNLGIVYEERGEPDVAMAHFAYAMEIDKNLGSAPANYGGALASMGDYAEAEPYYMRAISIDPGNALLHNQLGRVLVQQERFEDALVHLRIAAMLDPNDAETYALAGYAHERLGNFDKARYLYDKTLALKPEHSVATAQLNAMEERGDEAVVNVPDSDDVTP